MILTRAYAFHVTLSTGYRVLSGPHDECAISAHAAAFQEAITLLMLCSAPWVEKQVRMKQEVFLNKGRNVLAGAVEAGPF